MVLAGMCCVVVDLKGLGSISCTNLASMSEGYMKDQEHEQRQVYNYSYRIQLGRFSYKIDQDKKAGE